MATRHLKNDIGSMSYDKLIAGLDPAVHVNSGVITKLSTAATLKRGTVLSKGTSSGKLFVLGETQTYETHQDFEGDGSTTEFTVTAKPATLNKVTVDGAAKTITTDYTYTAATGKIAFTSAPADGKAIVAFYNSTDSGNPDCILCDDTDIGTAADENVAVYTAGCFNISALKVASGYTITQADKDKLRERGCFLGTVID